MDTNNVVALISGLSGVFVGAIGTGVALYLNRQQIKAVTISANRQVWINNLREEIAAFVENLQITGFSSLSEKLFPSEDIKAATINLLRQEAKIRLLLNPKEADHEELVDAMHKALNAASNPQREGTDSEAAAHNLREHVNTVIALSQQVLKREWVRVKAGG